MYDDEDPFIPIWEGPTIEAEHMRVRIEAEHIPVEFGDALIPGHARVEVPRSYLGEVRDVLQGVHAKWPEFTSRTSDGFDWKPWVRLAFVAMALVLLLFLVFTAFSR